MAFTHGVYSSEKNTSIISPVTGESGLPVVIGSAPVFLGNISNVNKPVLVYSYAEAVQALGFSNDWENYTLCEFIYSQFALFGQAPAVLINVFDPEKHNIKIEDREFTPINNKINMGQNILQKNLTFNVDNNFTSAYDEDGNLIVSFSGSLTSAIKATYLQASPELISETDIIGGIDANDNKKGLELVANVFPKFRLIPGIIAAPKWSTKPSVAAVMRAKCENINEIFNCISVVDIPCNSQGAPTYSSVPEWKNRNNYLHERQIACWPKVKLGDNVFHLSTQLIGIMNRTDNNHENIPYKSPSNELLQCDSTINDAGNEINLDIEQANYLNSQGITTALNFMTGWVAWGNRTAAYPANSDPKDCFIPVRRMFDYISNNFIQTFWQQVDNPITYTLIQTIINTFNIYLNGLAARQILLGGRIEFRDDENPDTDLISGILRFHIFITPPIPAETIEAVFEYDPQYLSELFAQ